MERQVLLTSDASRDLEELCEYIESHDSLEKAAHILSRLERVFSSLSQNPERGVYPKELTAAGIRDYREVFFKPYRIIYRVLGERVVVMVIADGRRNMQALLQRRLLRL